jgi:hypothetical protein
MAQRKNPCEPTRKIQTYYQDDTYTESDDDTLHIRTSTKVNENQQAKEESDQNQAGDQG